jgi:hypothetical protein
MHYTTEICNMKLPEGGAVTQALKVPNVVVAVQILLNM